MNERVDERTASYDSRRDRRRVTPTVKREKKSEKATLDHSGTSWDRDTVGRECIKLTRFLAHSFTRTAHSFAPDALLICSLAPSLTFSVSSSWEIGPMRAPEATILFYKID